LIKTPAHKAGVFVFKILLKNNFKPMRNLFQLALPILALALIGLSCKKENENPLIFVTPSSTQIIVQPNGFIEFNINVQAAAGLKNLRITRNINNTVTQTVLDTALTGNSLTVKYPYMVPSSGASQIYFVFTMTDNDGRQVATPRRLVVEGSALLIETTGHVMYSKFADNALSAFNISNANVFQLLPATDSSTVDVRDFDASDDDILNKQWSSNHGLQFVRNNSFDYANATFASAEASFNSSTPVDILSNINVNDKIIVKFGQPSVRYAVFDIIEIFDEAGSDSDRYRFNVKK
jgi:hypothetical protein